MIIALFYFFLFPFFLKLLIGPVSCHDDWNAVHTPFIGQSSGNSIEKVHHFASNLISFSYSFFTY